MELGSSYFGIVLATGLKTSYVSCSKLLEPIPVAARSKTSVYSRSLTGIVGSNPA
jgi:hypothetical protein